jgi:type IV pilus assembly protein PilM
MARRVIGLDIGTSAVRVAEVELGPVPRLVTFGQLALPPGAVTDGEITDPAVVAAVIARLWKELSLRRGAEVRLGLASPRLIVRTVELPQMPPAELAAAVRLNAADLIPIPVEEAVLDHEVLETLGPTPGPPTETTEPGAPAPGGRVRVLLAAAHRSLVERAVGAVRAAGLRVRAVDLVPLALIRSVGRRVSDNGEGAEAIVDVGAGLTVVVVHELGLPRFVRILSGGGARVTAALADGLGIEAEQAEALKRQLDAAPAETAARVRAVMAPAVDELAEAVRSSLDYARTQPEAPRILRIVLTGGGSLTPGLAARITELVGLPVEPARPRETLAIGELGFPEEVIPGLDVFLGVPAGLALGGRLTGKRINLVGGAPVGAGLPRGLLVGAAVGGAVLVLALGGLWAQKRAQLSDERSRLRAAEETNARLERRAAELADAQTRQREIESLRGQVDQLLATDVSWARMLQEIARTIPNDVWLTAFQGSVQAGGTGAARASTPGTGTTTTAPPPAGTGTAVGAPDPLAGVTPLPSVGGTVAFSASGLSFEAVAAWLQRIGEIPSFANLWVSSATRARSGGDGAVLTREVVTFSSNADLTVAATSDRRDRWARRFR